MHIVCGVKYCYQLELFDFSCTDVCVCVYKCVCGCTGLPRQGNGITYLCLCVHYSRSHNYAFLSKQYSTINKHSKFCVEFYSN